jgi:hypothetical protein
MKEKKAEQNQDKYLSSESAFGQTILPLDMTFYLWTGKI